MTAAFPALPQRLVWRVASLILGVLVLALMAAAVPLSLRTPQGLISGGGLALFSMAFAAVGFIIAWRQPRNPMGWLMLATAVSGQVTDDAGLYCVLDYRIDHGSLPLGWVAVLLQPTWASAITLFGLLFLLFPDGRLPSPRWRWMLWVYVAVATLWMAGAFTLAVGAIAGHNVHVTASGDLAILDHPTGSAAWWGAVQSLFLALLAASLLASVGGQIVSYLHAAGERRLQLKWLVSGAIVWVISLFIFGPLSSPLAGIWRVAGPVAFIGLFGLPVSMGVAILKYRLYDIDRIISRTLAYSIVTGLLVGLYAGLVTLASTVLGSTSPLVVAVSTLVVAALFNPVRRRVQRIVDRRFNRARYDAERTIAGFTARLQDAVELDEVSADLLTTVRQALEPAHAVVWLTGVQA